MALVSSVNFICCCVICRISFTFFFFFVKKYCTSPENLTLLLSSGLFLKSRGDEFVPFIILLLHSYKYSNFPSQKLKTFILPIKF